MSDESDRLKAARELAGFGTAADAAKAMGMEYATYAGHENGNRGFDKDDARRYSQKFKINVLWLLYGLGEPRGKSLDQELLAADPRIRADIEEYVRFKLSQKSPK